MEFRGEDGDCAGGVEGGKSVAEICLEHLEEGVGGHTSAFAE